MILRYVLFVVFVTSSAAATAATHCKSGEITYFSCQIAKSEKVVSLCGSAFRDNDRAEAEINDGAWLQYRFGRPSQLELVYPAKKEPLLTKFSAEYILANDNRLYSLMFTNSEFKYEVLFVHDWQILVEGRGKKIKLTCQGEPVTQRANNLNDFFQLVQDLSEQKNEEQFG